MIRKIFAAVILSLCIRMTADAQTGIWSGKLDVQGTELSLVFHLDDENPTVDSPDQGVRGIPAQMERGEGGKITVRIPSLGASYEGQWLFRQIAGTFRQMNLSLPLTLTPGEVRPARPQTPVGPFPYTTEEVSFTNGDVVLNGTLTLPEGYSAKTPALVMVTGSGIQNRDEELFEHKPFAVIADAFARAGIATLRYDDRGFDGYSGNINDCTTDDFKADALAGISLLRERFDKVGVIGHSEGGTIAFMLAAEGQADFIISLAGMVISGSETLVWQNRQALLAAGIQEEVVEAYCRLISEAFEARVNGGSAPEADNYDIPDALKQNYLAVQAQLRTPYMTRFISLDMRPLLAGITCPVLALNGTMDVQVEASGNLDALRSGLSSVENSAVEPVEGVNHLFQRCKTGLVTEYRDIDETISPEVLKRMTDWLLYTTTDMVNWQDR